MKIKTFLITLAVILGMAAFSIPVSANVQKDTEDKTTVSDSMDSDAPLTPSGNLTVIDDIHQTNDKDEVEDKQFITVQSKSGNTFYIVIDRSGNTENVYFLNAVDEDDLLTLIEKKEKSEKTQKTCSCSTKCDTGKVNKDCPVCEEDMNKCAGKAAPSPSPTPSEKPSQEHKPINSIVILIVFALLGGGAALYWFKLRNQKSSTKGTVDPNEMFEEDDEDYETESEDTEVETNSEQDCEIEDEDSNIDMETPNDESEEQDE